MPPPAGTVGILCVYNTSPPTLSIGNIGFVQCDSSGKLLGSVTATQGATPWTVQGGAANGATASGNPLQAGGVAQSAEAAVTAGQAAALVTDLARKLIVLPYANPENMGVGQVTSAMTGTSSTALTGMGAPGAGLRWYITSCTISNSHATVGTMVNLQDGSGGSTIWQFPAAPAYGGAAPTFPVPIRQPTTNTGVFAVNATTGSSTFVSCTGYKGA